MKLLLFRNQVELCGHICTINLIGIPHHHEKEDHFDWIIKYQGKFEEEVKEEVAVVLGPQFTIRKIEYRKGSVEISIIIATLGTIYFTISRYESFIKSLDLLTFHLRKILNRFLGPMDSYVSGGWLAGPALVHIPENKFPKDTDLIMFLLVLYLIMSNFALIFAFIWMLLRR